MAILTVTHRFEQSQIFWTSHSSRSQKCFSALTSDLKWNVMPLIRRGSNFVFFAALYCPCLGLLPCLQAWGMRDCNKGSKFKKGAMTCCKEYKITAPILTEKFIIVGVFPFVGSVWTVGRPPVNVLSRPSTTIMALFKKMDSRREVNFTSSAWKVTSSAWKWYYSFSREIFSFWEFFRSKQFS